MVSSAKLLGALLSTAVLNAGPLSAYLFGIIGLGVKRIEVLRPLHRRGIAIKNVCGQLTRTLLPSRMITNDSHEGQELLLSQA